MGFFRCVLGRAAVAAIAIGVLATAPPRAEGQTVTSGVIEGTATDTAGKPVSGATVTLIHHTTGWVRMVTTDTTGAFRSPALLPGRYDVRVELLGYRPLVVLDVTVSPAAAVALDVGLTPAEPPVTQVDTLAYVEGALHTALARGSWDPGGALADLADPRVGVGSLALMASLAGPGLAMQGLPDRMGIAGVDGLPQPVASSPGSSSPRLSTMGLPYTSLDHAEITPGTDVEWTGFGGGLISAFSARAPRDGQVRSYADVESGSLRGGLVVGGPVVRDTAWAMVGVDARRIETRLAAPWPSDSQANLAVTLASSARGADLSQYLRPVTERTDLITAFGRFDWQVADGQAVALRAAVTNSSSNDLTLGTDRPVGLGTSLDARDISASARFDSRITTNLGAQLSFEVDRSTRDYGAPSLPGSVLVSDGLGAGADPALPGRFERDLTRGSATVFYRLGAHELKGGFAASWTGHDIGYDPWRSGVYYFGSVTDLAQGRGAFVQSLGGVPAAAFTITSTAGFVQDVWSPSRGVSVLFGMRLERENWPTGGVSLNTEWLRLSGLANSAVPRLKTQVAPRLSFTWSAGPQREWLLRGDAGIFAEGADPSVLAEAMSHDGTAAFRRGVGTLGGWPGTPDSAAAPVTGPVLTLLNSTFQAPRTSRAGLSVAREIGAGASLQVAGQFRHTDFLARRSDLNLAAAPQATDQFGRPIYGTLQQFGGLLVATPGSNRRFPSFDRVWALDPSGYSDYYGVTVALERVRDQGLSLFMSYTYSRTTDNVPGLAGSVPEAQLSPFPSAFGSNDWRNGRSDLDVPHRATLGAELAVGPVRVAALVSYRSGLPFTPGFRPGVDANGDGAAGNDPAFVSDTVAGAASVLGQWACLRAQIGQFAARNSCRGPAVTSVDARFALKLFDLSGSPVEVIVDGVNLVATNTGIVDQALYLVDATKTLTTSASGSVVTVPLVANPRFGKLLYKYSPAAGVRAGLRFGL